MAATVTGSTESITRSVIFQTRELRAAEAGIYA
jgi:hypothetical protein